MECETNDSKKIFKVFEASKRKKIRKRKDEVDDTNSMGSEESKSLIHQANTHCIKSEKASLQNITEADQLSPGSPTPKRESSPSVPESPVRSPRRANRFSPGPRRHRRIHREDLSLALNAGLSSPRSASPQQEGNGLNESLPVDSTSYIYAFLEEAIKKDKRKHRRHRGDHMHSGDRNRDRSRRDYSRERRDNDREYKECERAHKDREMARNKDREMVRHRDRDRDRDYDDASTIREHHKHHRRHRHDDPSRDHEHDRPVKEKSQLPGIDQTVLLETFAKLCSTITEKNSNQGRPENIELVRNQSHKSLQCEVTSKNESCDVDQRPERLRSREPSHEVVHRSYTRVRSLEDVHNSRARLRSPQHQPHAPDDRNDKGLYDNVENSRSIYKQPPSKYVSKMDVVVSRTKPAEEERFRDYPALPTRSCMVHACRPHERRDVFGDIIDQPLDDRRRYFEGERRRCCEQKTSRSFDPHRELHPDEERLRRSTRSDTRKKRYDDDRGRYEDVRGRYDDARRYEDCRRYDDARRYEDVRRYDDGRRNDDGRSRHDNRRDRYYEEREREYRERHTSNIPSKDRRYSRAVDRCERASVLTRDDEYKDMSERERDSALSVADGEVSTVSEKSNYIRVVKQGIAEQRDAMDKMMKLWKELMRCFKTISQSPAQGTSGAQDSTANVRESAAAQLRLWRECMRRYETVARDVGDTDARLMDEIAKQRSEMAEMANMWQECLQRYRDMTNDFNNLKQQLKTENPSRAASSRPLGPPLVCAEGEGTLPPAPYCLPPAYPPPPPAMTPMGGGYVGSPLRQRASAPPAWWWMNEHPSAAVRRSSPPAGRRRSSPDSRRSVSHSPGRDHRHRHKDRDREDSRYKEKASSKPSAARSEHRHRKR